jgi:hypothetical protein
MALHDFEVPKNAGDYYVRAIHELYPTLRDGVDFVVARPDTETEYVITQLGTAIVEADVIAAADQMLAQDPYVAYTPNPA